MRKVLKAVLPIVCAFGTAIGAANAAQQRVDIHPAYKNLSHMDAKREASKLKGQVDHPETVVPQLGYTDTLAMMEAAKGADIMIFAHKAANATADMIKYYIDNAMLAADGPFILQTVANTANAAADATATAAIAGWAAAGFHPNEMPADLSRDAFTTALMNLMGNLDAARLNAAAVAAGGRNLALPARLTSHALGDEVLNVKRALHQVIHDWVVALMNADAAFLHAGLPNLAGGIALLGAPEPWMPHAADLTRDHFEAALHHIVDEVQHYN